MTEDEAKAQSALSAWGDSDDSDEGEDPQQSDDHSVDFKGSYSVDKPKQALGLYHQPVLTEDSCPWCLAPASEFRENDNGTVACDNCSSAIPIEAEWYQEGKKIVTQHFAQYGFRLEGGDQR